MYRRTASFADDMRQALHDTLATEIAPRAIKILNEIMCDEKMPASAKGEMELARAEAIDGQFVGRPLPMGKRPPTGNGALDLDAAADGLKEA